MFLEAFVLGLMIGYIRKGKISRLAYVNFNNKTLIYIAAFLYFAIIVMNLGLFNYNSSLYGICLLFCYIFTILFLISNISMKYMYVPLLGLSLNLIVFIANKLKFPLSSKAAATLYGTEIYDLLINGKILFFTPAEGAKLSFLGNTILVGNRIILSIGDIIASIGLTLVVQAIISDKFLQNKSKLTFSKDIFK